MSLVSNYLFGSGNTVGSLKIVYTQRPKISGYDIVFLNERLENIVHYFAIISLNTAKNYLFVRIVIILHTFKKFFSVYKYSNLKFPVVNFIMVVLSNFPPPTQGIKHEQPFTVAVVNNRQLGKGTLIIAERYV